MSTYTLTGSGVQALATPGSVAVAVTTLPSFPHVGGANPTNYYQLGLLRFGNTHGYLPPIPVDAVAQLIPLATGMTLLGYALAPGVTITVEERAEVPYAGPTGPPGATGASGSSSLSFATADLATDISVPSGGSYTDAISLSLAAGTWLIIATITVQAGGSGSETVTHKLWDGTTLYASAETTTGTNWRVAITTSAIVAPSVTTTYKVSVAVDNSIGTIKAATVSNGNPSKATHIRAIKIA